MDITGAIANGWDNTTNWLSNHSLRDNPVSNFLFGKNPGPQPGVGGPAADPSRLVQDPTTGMFYDPATGTTYTNASGTVPVTNPNVAQQVAMNVQNATAARGQLGAITAEGAVDRANQTALAEQFKKVISGQAPSVAQMQTQQQQDAIARQQLAQTAGASGASAPLAGLMAARNTGLAQVDANNTGAIARVKEQNDAANSLNALYAAQNQAVNQEASRIGGEAVDYSNIAASGQAAQQGLNQQAALKKSDDESKFGMSFIKGLASGFGGIGGGGGGGGGGGDGLMSPTSF